MTITDITDERIGPMRNPPHLGELIRKSMDDEGWSVIETSRMTEAPTVGAVGPD